MTGVEAESAFGDAEKLGVRLRAASTLSGAELEEEVAAIKQVRKHRLVSVVCEGHVNK